MDLQRLGGFRSAGLPNSSCEKARRVRRSRIVEQLQERGIDPAIAGR
jgi:hypothetical protein